MTILGTRPEIIRLSRVIEKLDRLADKHVLVHTGQNYDHLLSGVFFEQMRIRKPDHTIQVRSHSFGSQVGQIFAEVEQLIRKEQPDRLLLLGDTNSALCAVLGERLGVPVYHMEAGNRCNDHSVPEEINRKVIDSISTFNLPYTLFARENLLREGIPAKRIWVSGNPIYEVLQYYKPDIDQSDVLQRLGLTEEGYLLATIHRAENVDHEERLQQIARGLRLIADQSQLPIIVSVHPRTKDRLQRYGIQRDHPLIRFSEPFGFFDFVKLQRHARCVITDSGTVQEESCILGIPAVTVRQSTERAETILCGSNILSGLVPEDIAACVKRMMETRHAWPCPEGYTDEHVSTKVVNYVLGGLTYV